MRRAALFVPALLALALSASARQAAPVPAVDFAVAVADPESGAIQVEMTVDGNAQAAVELAMPAWAPGAYRIVKYGKALRSIAAAAPDGTALPVTAVDDQTWRVEAGGRPRFVVRYEMAVDRTRMDRDHCYIAGPDTYMYVVGRKDAPCRVRFRLPEGWKVATGLDFEGDAYVGRDYDTFIDCPTELGRFDLHEFEEAGVLFQVVVHAKGPVNAGKIVDMCRRIVREHHAMFGPPPFKRYVFLYHFMDRVGGRGLEHLNSTDISMSYAAIRAEPLLAASVTSHEYFHLWNVKRIRPFELGPFDYTREVRSKHLWFCEGVTSYFGDRALVRAGIWSEPGYFAHLASEIESLQNNPERRVTSVEKAAWTVWDKREGWRVDYYNKGELLGLLIDLTMRAESGGKKTFDDVLRRLYDEYVVKPAAAGKGWIGVGFPDDGLLRAMKDVGGRDWSDFFARYVSGVEELPYEEVFKAVGLAPTITVLRSPDLGVELLGTIVRSVPPDGEAHAKGLRAGDRLVSIDGAEVHRGNVRETVAKLSSGEETRLRLQRGDATLDVALKVGVRERTTASLRRAADATPEQKKLVDRWLGKKADY